jgi:hypothetical protein
MRTRFLLDVRFFLDLVNLFPPVPVVVSMLIGGA